MKAIKLCAKAHAGKPANNTIQTLILAITGGFFIGVAGMIANVATHNIDNAGLARLIYGLIFPAGIIMLTITHSKLFTGNTLAVIAVADGELRKRTLLWQWLIVYIGNFIGAFGLAAAVVFIGQLGMSDESLAKYTMQIAAAKCAIPPMRMFISAILCNILVCTAVLMSMEGDSLLSRAAGAYVPVMAFTVGTLEHSVANMFLIGAGLFASMMYGGSGFETLTWTGFGVNLLFVTLGNVVGGILLGLGLRYSFKRN